MVGFCDLSDSDNSTIEEIISQAQDACVLEQVSAINCSGFTDSVLPFDLESRFRKLKSFPASKRIPPPNNGKARSFSTLSSRNLHDPLKGNHQSPNFSPSKENPNSGIASSPTDSSIGKKGMGEKTEKPKTCSVSTPSGSSSRSFEESSESSVFRSKQKDEGMGLNRNSISSPLKSSNLFMGSPSPPRKAGCFWCSPKKKKSKENVVDVGWDKSDYLLPDLGSFSMKEQRKILKKAMKEEEKISREAEKIVEWAKSASARINVSDLEDELSD